MPEEDIVEPTTSVEKKSKPIAKQSKPKLRIDFDEPAKSFDFSGGFKGDVGENKKLFNKGDSVEKMERNTIEFVANTSRKAFATIEKEEEDNIKELVSRKYYPIKATKPETEEDMVKSRLNLV